MNEWIEVTAKTVDDAIIEAGIKLGVSTESMEYEVIEKESSGFLGLNKKPAKIRAKVKEEEKPAVEDFLCKVFEAMGVKAEAEISFDEEEKTMNINLTGDDMGMLIGKRGQTLDSLQYLVSLVANKDSDTYIKVKLDTARPLIFDDVVVRVSDKFALAMHIDTDESNAACAFGAVYGEIVK